MAASRPPLVVISGAARGADRYGEQLAKSYGIAVRRFPAKWATLGLAAGPLRNVQMARYARDKGEGGLIAVWDGQSRGTQHMINTARQHGLRVFVHRFA